MQAPRGTLFLAKEARIYSGAKIAFSINGAGKLDSYIGAPLDAILKDKLKMD